MEVIGSLASGIAHDLNNVLSGINTYPEVLLMDIKTNDPLRKPIEIIQKSGQKSADIVQDMLNLARRGVSIKVMVDLNAIVLDYLTRSEYKKLRSFHPLVEVETRLEESKRRLTPFSQ
jgi:two-component system, cell cycle sensor histidine kinase and response regulator CckA